MDWRELYEKFLKKWTARIILAFVLLTVVIHTAHLLNYLKWIPGPHLLETVGFASFFLITLLLETFFASDKKLDDLSGESKRKMDLVSQRLDGLSQQMDSTTGTATYSELSVFMNKWQNLREKFDFVMLVGELPICYAEEVRRMCEQDKRDQQAMKEKEISVYRSLHTSSRKEIIELIELASEARPDLVKLYHMYGFEWGSWAMGRNRRGDETEVLLNYANAHGSALAGLHLSGKAAESFAKATTQNLNEVGLSGASYPPVRLASREQVDFIIEEKVEYQKKIKEMVEMGFPIEGADRICEAMADLVQNTQRYLDVTHLCVDEGAIERLQNGAFQKWVEANYKAVQRGVKIRRIFIVPRVYYNHPILEQVKKQMQSNNIEVSMCRLDSLWARLQEDFSIYDEQHLVYMDKTRIFWSGTQQEPLARRTENLEKIKDYRNIFSSLESHVDK